MSNGQMTYQVSPYRHPTIGFIIQLPRCFRVPCLILISIFIDSGMIDWLRHGIAKKGICNYDSISAV